MKKELFIEVEADKNSSKLTEEEFQKILSILQTAGKIQERRITDSGIGLVLLEIDEP